MPMLSGRVRHAPLPASLIDFRHQWSKLIESFGCGMTNKWIFAAERIRDEQHYHTPMF
jgi:hypothetical protein